MPAEWQIGDAYGPLAATRRRKGLERGLAELFRRQKQLIRLEQLRELGLGKRGVAHRVAHRSLHRIHRSVFAAHPPPYSPHQRWLAATYACGPASFISDVTAVEALGLTEGRWATIHVTNASGGGRSLSGITVHRRDVDPRDVLVRHGIRCTSAARTIVDCAAILDAEALEEMLMAADSKRILNRRRLAELIAEHRGRRGIRTSFPSSATFPSRSAT